MMRPQRGQFYSKKVQMQHNARIMMLGVANILFSSACFISIEFRHVYIKPVTIGIWHIYMKSSKHKQISNNN